MPQFLSISPPSSRLPPHMNPSQTYHSLPKLYHFLLCSLGTSFQAAPFNTRSPTSNSWRTRERFLEVDWTVSFVSYSLSPLLTEEWLSTLIVHPKLVSDGRIEASPETGRRS